MDNSRKDPVWPEFALVAMTRGALGVGIGLLAAPRLTDQRRVAAGWALLLVGIATTVPLLADVLSKRD